MKRLLYCLLLILILLSCGDDENVIDKSQLTSGIWYYEFEPNSFYTSAKLIFRVDGTYSREYAVPSGFSPGGILTILKEGTWTYADNNVIDLTDYGICVQPEVGPPCIPPDVDFKILQLKKEFLEIEELYNGKPSALPSKKKFINTKP